MKTAAIGLVSLSAAVHALPVVPTGSMKRTDHAVNHILKLLHGDSTSDSNSTTHFYHEAVLDHFDSSVAAPSPTWKQRYYCDESFWGGEGYPVFLYIGGEGPQGPMTERMFIYAQAQKHRALLVTLEHRFYGESAPTTDMSDENLRYLTSAQALGDLARFVEYVSSYDGHDASSTPPLELKASPKRSKWMAFGGSYPGNLAAWFKMKYPFLTVGVVASSAPVFAEYDFAQYSEVTGDALAYPLIGGSAACEAQVRQGVFELARAVDAGDLEALPESLRPCGSVAATLDRAQFYSSVFSNFQGVVQYNEEQGHPFVSDVCDAIDGATSALDALAAATDLFTNGTCLESDFQKDYVDLLTNVTFDGLAADRQWTYQSCNEFGYFQTASKYSTFFSFASVLNVTTAGQAVCAAAFQIPDYSGPRSNAAGPVALTQYGGRTLEGLNITAVNGNMDPWHALGVVNATDKFYVDDQRTSSGVHVVELDGTAHCRDMYAPNAFAAQGVEDSPSVKWAHAAIAADMDRYLYQ